MAISREILSQIMFDFSTGPDTEVLNVGQDDPFWEWFLENANRYSPCEYLDSLYSDNHALPGNCFGNSQGVALQEGIDYCEGFCRVQENFIFHGFNIFDNCVIDSTVQSNPNNFVDGNNILPNEYYGVIIPANLIENVPNGNSDVNYINRQSKLYDYFLNAEA